MDLFGGEVKNKLAKALLLVVAISTALISGVVWAQSQASDDASGFKVAPVRVEVEAERGLSQTQTIELENVTGVKLTAVAIVDDFSPPENEGGDPQLLIGENSIEDYPHSIKPFVRPIGDIVLEPGEARDIPITLTVPSDAPPGAYYGIVRFVNKASAEGSNVALAASVGTIFLVRVPGDTIEVLHVEEVSAAHDGDTSSFFSSPPDSVVIRLRNGGNTFIAPRGDVTITDWRGNSIFNYELNFTTPPGNVLPDSIRRFENDIDSIGSFGRFTINANIYYGGGGDIIEVQTSFWVIPWGTLLVILAALTAAILVGTRGVKAYNSMILRRAKGSRR